MNSLFQTILRTNEVKEVKSQYHKKDSQIHQFQSFDDSITWKSLFR